MKRSEAVKLIATQIKIELDEFPEEFSGYETTAEIILTCLEKAGMLPPRVQIQGTQFSDNCWEKE